MSDRPFCITDAAAHAFGLLTSHDWRAEALWLWTLLGSLTGALPAVAAGLACVHYVLQIYNNWPRKKP